MYLRLMDVLVFIVLQRTVTVVATKHIAVEYEDIENDKPMVITW